VHLRLKQAAFRRAAEPGGVLPFFASQGATAR